MTINNLVLLGGVWLLFEIAFVAIGLLYFVFSLIVVRQVSMITQTVRTEAGPVLRAISIMHAVVALLVLVLFISFLFS